MLDHTSLAQALFSLLTPADRAESIAGDLTEERGVRGSAWFWAQVFRITFALFGRAVWSAPFATLTLGALGFAVFVALAFIPLAAVTFHRSPASWLVLSLYWWGAALWTGFTLVSIAPKVGMAACSALAIVSESLLITLGLLFFSYEVPDVWSVFVYTSALLAALPAMAGGAIGHHRLTSSGPKIIKPGSNL